jgi:large subunit ribosomal protein L29
MKAAEVRSFSNEQIEAAISDLREEWRGLRFDDAVGRMTNTSRISQIKRDIARLKTIQTERVMAEEIAALTGAGTAARR